VHAPHAAGVAVHAERALAAVATHRRAPASPGADAVGHASHHAVALWNAHLFFEVHEVLEAVWKTAAGETRQALQGVIQIAVAFHHLAHGNPRGARSLLREGRERVASVPGDALPALDLAALLTATAAWEASLAGGTLPLESPPRLDLVSASA